MLKGSAKLNIFSNFVLLIRTLMKLSETFFMVNMIIEIKQFLALNDTKNSLKCQIVPLLSLLKLGKFPTLF